MAHTVASALLMQQAVDNESRFQFEWIRRKSAQTISEAAYRSVCESVGAAKVASDSMSSSQI